MRCIVCRCSQHSIRFSARPLRLVPLGRLQIFLFCRFRTLLQKLTDEAVLTLEKLVEGAIEDEAAFFEHEEGGIGVGVAGGERDHATPFGVVAVIAEGEGVLQAMGDEQGGSCMNVALLDDELDDGGGGDGIEAAGGRVVEDQLGFVDEGAGDGHAPPHAAGKAGRIKVEGFFEADEAERLADAAVDLLVGHALLNQLVGDIVAYGEGIEERAFLEDHSGAGAQGEELLLGHAGDVFAEEHDAALLGAKQPDDQFEQHTFAHAGRPKQDARLRGRHRERNVLKHRRTVERDRDAAQGDDRGRIRRWSRRLRRGSGGVSSCGKDREQHVGDEEVDEDDEHRGVDDGLNGGAAHALGAACGSHAVEAADGAEDVAKEERFDEPLDNIGDSGGLRRPRGSTGCRSDG